ncbi:MAG: M20/M25/M40 family metallo-hydrolase [Pyrinomonadaceae bacterium]|nr:M20/M25/M40 family metallo-hydrolase [Pyrinomonadaceae bacterium]
MFKFKAILSALFFVTLVGCFHAKFLAQTVDRPPSVFTDAGLSRADAIRRYVLSSDYAYKQAGYLSNNIGPRLSGSPQAARAVEYVAEEMRRLGAEVRLQKCMVPHWVRGEASGEVVEWTGMAPGTTQRIVLAALGGSVATPDEGIATELVVVDDYDALAALGEQKVKGKIVLFNFKFDQQLQSAGFGGGAYGQAVQYRFGAAMAAAKLGAVAVLVRSAGGSQNRLAHTGSMGYADGIAKIPGAAVSYEDAEMLAYLAAAGPVKIKIRLTPRTLPDAESHNVIADVKGSEHPEQIVIVSGHLDSWDLGTGALDDAAGVAASMAVIEALRALKIRPKRTIRFIAWMNEENGGRGSKAYFDELKDTLADHIAAIEADLGASHPVGFNFAGKAEAIPLFAPLSKLLLLQGAAMVQHQPGGVGADIGPLTKAGVPSFAPWYDQRTYFNYHHTAADTFDKIDPKQLAEVAALVSFLAVSLADMEGGLPR